MVEIVNEIPIAVKHLLNNGGEELERLTNELDDLVEKYLQTIYLTKFIYLDTNPNAKGGPIIDRFNKIKDITAYKNYGILPRNYLTDDGRKIHIRFGSDVLIYLQTGHDKNIGISQRTLFISKHYNDLLAREVNSLKLFDEDVREYFERYGFHQLGKMGAWSIIELQNKFLTYRLDYKDFFRHYQLDDGRIVKCSIGPEIATMEKCNERIDTI